jgi:8-amino-7-oxononanoate synthase
MMESYEDELRTLESKGLKRSVKDRALFKGVNLSSNDYLGLSMDASLQEAAEQAIRSYGTGGTASRLLAGTSKIHLELEAELAKFLGKEAALVFSSGYHTNTGLIPALAGIGDVVFIDRLCHASILDGIKLSNARFYTFKHNNPDDLEQLLNDRRKEYKRAIVVTEGVFSMDGDQPDLKRLSALAHEHDALLYVDEAHSFGVFGLNGRGWASEQGVLDQVDVFVGTLSKTLASQGGFVAANKTLIDYFTTKSRSFIYTTALAPACAGAALAALRRLPIFESRRKFLLKTAAQVSARLAELGYRVLSSGSQIIPVWTGDIEATQKLSQHLFDQGFFVPSIRPPTIPAGEGRVRLSITHDVAARGIENLIKAFERYEGRLVQTH